MYGTGIGTGVSGTAAMYSVATGSTILAGVCALAMAATGLQLVRNFGRRAANKRP